MPNIRPAMGMMGADPFDVSTGVYYREYPDLYVKDSIPLIFARTQRNMDTRSRSFGVGASTSYDMFIIGDVQKFTWVALVNPDGSQIHYSRISPGTGYADGVFEDTTSPTEFLGSRIFWNHGSWTVHLQNGTEYAVQGCSASSKPGQCGVVQIRDARGDRVMIRRDREGNIVRIISPHGHYIAVQSDPAGRIVHAEDDQGHWVNYDYAPAGWLKKATTWRGETDEFKYDAQFNMTWVGEKDSNTPPGRYNFTVINRYDVKNRFKWQKVDFGDRIEIYSARYHEDSKGKIRETDVRSPDGLSRYFFNADRYATREQFVPLRGPGWTLEFTLAPKTNDLTDTWLSCPSGRLRVPEGAGKELRSMGDGYQEGMSKVCGSLKSRRSSPRQHLNSRPKKDQPEKHQQPIAST